MKIVSSDELRAWIAANERDEVIPAPPPEPEPEPEPEPTEPMPLGPAGADKWTMVFQDEFEGTTLDKSKWNDNWLGAPGTITKPVNSAELAAYDPAQVSVSGRHLRLTAIEKPVRAADGRDYRYRSGLIETNKFFLATEGYFEARIKMPASGPDAIAYNWGAFWLNGRHSKWPDQGENDIMENLSGGPTWHYHSPAGSTGGKALTKHRGPEWHVYAGWWFPNGKVAYFYDGEFMGERTSGVLNFPNYIIVNYGISTRHGGPLSVPQTMLVDYVRAWKAA